MRGSGSNNAAKGGRSKNNGPRGANGRNGSNPRGANSRGGANGDRKPYGDKPGDRGGANGRGGAFGRNGRNGQPLAKGPRRRKPLPPDEFYIDLYPLEGIEWRDLKLGFGATRDEVLATFARDKSAGQPREGVDRDGHAMIEFFGRELVVGFDADGLVDLFEFTGSWRGRLHPRIAHIDLTRVDADSSLELIASKIGALDDSGAPYEYVFQRASICLFRESSPDDFGDMIHDGLFSNGTERREEEMLASRWASVAIGQKGFYDEGPEGDAQ